MNPAPPRETREIDAELRPFKTELVATIPALRAFARSLCRNPTQADDLVQETLLKAWAARKSFIAGTNFKAWTFRILRNAFYSTWRKDRRLTPMDDSVYENTAQASDNAETALELAEVSAAIQKLPMEQREALILISAGGFIYEEVAEIAGVAVGTIKSRVSRARATLHTMLAKRTHSRQAVSAIGIVDRLISDADQLSSHPMSIP